MRNDRLTPAEEDQPNRIDRWAFIASLLGGAAALGGVALAGLRFLFPNATLDPPLVFKVGEPDAYEPGSVTADPVRQVFIVRDDAGIYVLDAVCTHLGCMTRWNATDGVFICPCHGSKFRKNGVNFAGPAPSPLRHVKVTLGQDGRLVVDKSAVIDQSDWGNAMLPV
jgi:cytochrome b6-f complex iron-sulfur subunit